MKNYPVVVAGEDTPSFIIFIIINTVILIVLIFLSVTLLF